MESAELYRRAMKCTAEEACGIAHSICGEIFCLAYTPVFCGFIEPEDIDSTHDIFTLRCFCGMFESRWTRKGSSGWNVIISEDPSCGDFEGKFFTMHSCYLLWGKGARKDGKISLFEHRTGTIKTPSGLGLKEGCHVRLNFTEYFRPDPMHGNMTFCLERLTGLEVSEEDC